MSLQQKDEQVLEQTEQIWRFLDEMSLKDPKEYETFIQKVLKDGENENMGPPVPSFVVQTEKVPQVIPIRKYFINFTKWHQLPKPENETSPVAMTTSNIRKEIIEKEWAYIIDVTLNPEVYPSDTSPNQLQRRALVELVFRHIESKHSLQFSRKFEFCEEKYIGNRDSLLDFICPSAVKNKLNNALNGTENNLTLDQIRNLSKGKENNKIVTGNQTKSGMSKKSQPTPASVETIKTSSGESVDSMKELKTKTLGSHHGNKTRLPAPKVEMMVNKDGGNIELRIELPKVDTVAECDLEITENCVMLEVPLKYKLDFTFPLKVDFDEANAKFIKDQKVLLIIAPIDK
ncbi:PIH1 domain-containing protein 2-like [Clytia hemisphaerica]|uniref:PIH1 domain-containing protein 2-like n=1 Tax=Clytia hemisphaerica TaxID=252671 RepID=UPI0034D4EA0B